MKEYRVIDLMLYQIENPHFVRTFQDNLNRAYATVKGEFPNRRVKLCSTHRDYGSIFAIFEVSAGRDSGD